MAHQPHPLFPKAAMQNKATYQRRCRAAETVRSHSNGESLALTTQSLKELTDFQDSAVQKQELPSGMAWTWIWHKALWQVRSSSSRTVHQKAPLTDHKSQHSDGKACLTSDPQSQRLWFLMKSAAPPFLLASKNSSLTTYTSASFACFKAPLFFLFATSSETIRKNFYFSWVLFLRADNCNLERTVRK